MWNEWIIIDNEKIVCFSIMSMWSKYNLLFMEMQIDDDISVLCFGKGNTSESGMWASTGKRNKSAPDEMKMRMFFFVNQCVILLVWEHFYNLNDTRFSWMHQWTSWWSGIAPLVEGREIGILVNTKWEGLFIVGHSRIVDWLEFFVIGWECAREIVHALLISTNAKSG